VLGLRNLLLPLNEKAQHSLFKACEKGDDFDEKDSRWLCSFLLYFIVDALGLRLSEVALNLEKLSKFGLTFLYFFIWTFFKT
jgi:hypothetical protein